MTNYYFRIVKYLPVLLIYFACSSGFSFAQENIVSNETASGAGASSAQKNIVSQESVSGERSSSSQDTIVSDETVSAAETVPASIKKIATEIKKVIAPATSGVKEKEKQATVVKEELKKKEEKLEEAKKEARKALEEKILLEKKALTKKEAAAVTRQELEAVKEEAAVSKTPEAIRKVKELSSKAEKFDKEAAAADSQLQKVSLRTEDAMSKLAASETKIQQLKKALEALRQEELPKMTWVEKGTVASVLISAGLCLIVLFKLVIRKFEDLVTAKGKIREGELGLRIKTLSRLFYWLVAFSIVVTVIYLVLQTFGFNVMALLAGAGIVGLALGFGGQYFIRDVINGFFILLEEQYRIDDVIKVGEYTGVVENINLRITTLRDLDGRVITIPNSEIKIVMNYTQDYSQALFNVGVAYKENVDRVMEAIKELGKEMRQDAHFGNLILEDLEMFGIDAFKDSQVMIKFRIKTLPVRQWEVAREFRRRLKNRFDELGIEMPFPHRTLYVRTGSDGEWLQKFTRKYSPDKKIERGMTSDQQGLES
ncbi:MAG TPA: mechanosensitive ion channel domain-containing protein [Nitrospirota bacterium]|nr:mechanosensitive ion channel domain-containing protein [Nitrospirota bacterium]